MQEDAYTEGFLGSNERELFLRENIADYILSKLNDFMVIKSACNNSCGPSDYYKGGKCDKMGCYEA
jgi:hypothetical protein